MSVDVVTSAAGRAAPGVDRRTTKTLARSLFKDMESYGIPNEKILEVASELIGLVTERLKETEPQSAG